MKWTQFLALVSAAALFAGGCLNLDRASGGGKDVASDSDAADIIGSETTDDVGTDAQSDSGAGLCGSSCTTSVCQDAECVGGKCVTTYKPAGTHCGPDLVCDGNGGCSACPEPSGCCADAGDCDDTDPCRKASCIDGVCSYDVDPNCKEIEECSTHGGVSVAEAHKMADDTKKMKIIGSVGAGAALEACMCKEDDEEHCHHASVLRDDTSSDKALPLFWGMTPGGDNGCWSNGCGDVSGCEPMYDGRTYVVWGKTSKYVFDHPWAEPLETLIVDVQGWCLSGTPEGLQGYYAGLMTGNKDDGTELCLPVRVEIQHSDSQYKIWVKIPDAARREGFGLHSAEAFDVSVDETTGAVGFGISAKWNGGELDLTFDLLPVREENTLTGTVTFVYESSETPNMMTKVDLWVSGVDEGFEPCGGTDSTP